MKYVVLLYIMTFSPLASASDYRGLLPYVVGTTLLVLFVLYYVVFLLTVSVENRWHRFYMRVMTTPTLLTLFLLSIGINLYAFVPVVIGLIYICAFRLFTEWLRQ
jgi:hypothetical protein